ncbi:MAG TPA: CHASE3 domain-containing protein, partial [Vicinamibacteria bacterium]|nr:CHASE3 domain-containing protein [Vicinamibacteria bacterium]
MGLVLLSLVSLLAVPRVVARRIEARQHTIVNLIMPARTLLGRIQLDLATQMAAARGYLITRDLRFRREFEIAAGNEEERFRSLRPLAEAIGPDVLRVLTELHASKVAWTDVMPDLPSGTMTANESRDGLDRNSLFQNIIHHASNLDEALAAHERRSRDQISRLMAVQDLLVTGLALMALFSAGAVAWLAGRSRKLG